MTDPTEEIRRDLLVEINADPGSREALEANQLAQDFEVEGFLAPIVVVRRRSDGQRGSLSFQHHPRFYFEFVPYHG